MGVSDHFDIVAKADASAPANQMSEMIKSLLADRFKLKAHMDAREQPIYALVLARSDGTLGPQFRQSAIDCAALAAARGRGPVPEGAGGNEEPQAGKRPYAEARAVRHRSRQVSDRRAA